MKNKPTMLMILDGYGISDSDFGNAIAAADTPNLDKIFRTYPRTRIDASGLAVGLPEGQMGNSEVGHLNIGAGRIVYQELTKITKAIEDGIFFDNIPLNNAIDHVLNSVAPSNFDTSGAADSPSSPNEATVSTNAAPRTSCAQKNALHLFGLLSDGGVHSHLTHLFALIKLAKSRGIENLYVHCFMDGRDVPPTSGIDYMKQLNDFMEKESIGKVGIVSGRYYAMDRDKRWERLEQAYDALTIGDGRSATDGISAVSKAYDSGETDEFILPTVCSPYSIVKDGDSIIMYNFRPDRAREITRAFTDADFDGFKRKKVINNLKYVCMTQYDATMPNVEIAFPPQRLENTLGEYVSGLGLHQLRIAETEKYAHVTFFFNGGVETPNPLEDRILIPSPQVATYDLQPEMSARLVTEEVLKEIQATKPETYGYATAPCCDSAPSDSAAPTPQSSKYDLIILNFANADMVGHTGDFNAAVKAVETLDECVGKIVPAVLSAGGQILLTADHGNADCMLDEDNNVVTAHSTNQVPLVHIAKKPVASFKSGGNLADIAPTLLKLMDLDIPSEMTGNCLV